MSLFNLGKFKLHSGQETDYIIDCDELSDSDLECVGHLLLNRVWPYSQVEGVPRGGLRLARVMEKFSCKNGLGFPLLIVDDVFTTGASMEQQRAGRPAKGAVIFARAHTLPSWVTALFSVNVP